MTTPKSADVPNPKLNKSVVPVTQNGTAQSTQSSSAQAGAQPSTAQTGDWVESLWSAVESEVLSGAAVQPQSQAQVQVPGSQTQTQTQAQAQVQAQVQAQAQAQVTAEQTLQALCALVREAVSECRARTTEAADWKVQAQRLKFRSPLIISCDCK